MTLATLRPAITRFTKGVALIGAFLGMSLAACALVPLYKSQVRPLLISAAMLLALSGALLWLGRRRAAKLPLPPGPPRKANEATMPIPAEPPRAAVAGNTH